MPKDWPLEALKAQAVAARTYAVRASREGRGLRPLLGLAQPGLLRRRLGGARPVTRGDARRAARSSRYEGKLGPDASTSRRAAAGRISALDVFGTDVPYLVAVDDPWDEVVAEPPLAERSSSRGAQLAKRFGLGGAVDGRRSSLARPASPAVIRLTTTGAVVRRPAERRARPARAEVHRLPARRPAPRRAGSRSTRERDLRLTGLARDVDDVVLEQSRWPGLLDQGAPAAPGRRRDLRRARSASTRRPSIRLVRRRARRPAAHRPDQGVSRGALPGRSRAAPCSSLPACPTRPGTTWGSRPEPEPPRSPPRSSGRPARGRRASRLCVRWPSTRPQRRSVAWTGVAWVERARVAPARLHADRPARAPPVVRGRQPRVRRLGRSSAARGGSRGGDRLGRRSGPSRPRAADRRLEELRRRHRRRTRAVTARSWRASSRPSSTTRRESPASRRRRS